VLSVKQRELSNRYCESLAALAWLGATINDKCRWCQVFYAEYEALFVNGMNCREIQGKLCRHMEKEGLLEECD